MKRRDFLIASTAGVAGTAFPRFGIGQTRPCPPPTVGIAGGTSVTTTCGDVDAEKDWTARSTGPGVMWAHDFRTDFEVDRFRWDTHGEPNAADIQPNNVQRITTDGITGGGCLQISVPSGGIANGSWGRPFSAMPGDLGYVSGPDWDHTNPSQGGNWDRGWYGHSDYHSQSQFDGTDFYIQFRVKLTNGRANSGNPPGKLVFIGRNHITPNQEIVISSDSSLVYKMYTNFGSRSNSFLTSNQADQNGSWQPGGDYALTCIDGQHNANSCWSFPIDEWVTVLIHIIPGHHNGPDDNPNMETGMKDTGIQVWVAVQGETSYTKIWDKLDFIWSFDPKPFGWNMFIPSAYMNGVRSVEAWSHRFDQIIFSKQFVACPQV